MRAERGLAARRTVDQALPGDEDIVYGLYATIIVTPALLLTAWVLPRRMRYAIARKLTAWCALLPPVTVILLTGSLSPQ
ncbi:hypothetical protein [Streptomyces blastmyceticus]|uniref:Uncharacterized protein n=1 Tax=Streptomyces blastmyceticus TaxID=68180 RepID=A0ABP3GKN0_9ACTN